MENYQTQTGNKVAFAAGIALLIIWGFIYFSPPDISQRDFYTYTLPLRIVIAIWVYQIAKKQDRTLWWSVLGFFFPAVVLIIMGWTRSQKNLVNPEVSSRKFNVKLPSINMPSMPKIPKPKKEIFTSKIAYMIYVLLFVLIVLYAKYSLDVMKDAKHFELKRQYETGSGGY